MQIAGVDHIPLTMEDLCQWSCDVSAVGSTQVFLVFFSRAINSSLSEGLEEYKPGEASQVMLDVLALSNSSMVERH